jgi:hypothetical protein
MVYWKSFVCSHAFYLRTLNQIKSMKKIEAFGIHGPWKTVDGLSRWHEKNRAAAISTCLYLDSFRFESCRRVGARHVEFTRSLWAQFIWRWKEKSSGSGLESRDYGRMDPSRWPCGTLYPQKLVLTSLTRGGRSVGTVRSRTQATQFSFLVCYSQSTESNCCNELRSLWGQTVLAYFKALFWNLAGDTKENQAEPQTGWAYWIFSPRFWSDVS